MTVLVTGSRGAVASALIPLLLDKGIAVRAASADPSRLTPLDGVSAVACDLTDASTFPAALEGVESVFLYAEPAEVDAFLKEAAAAGVGHIVLLSSSSVLEARAEGNPIAQHHVDVERALTASPIKSTLLRPGSFAGNAAAWAWPIKAGRPVDLPYPAAHTDPIHERDIAEAALAVLTGPELRGRAFTLTGPESLTFARQIDVLAAATGLPIKVNAVTAGEWKAQMAEYLSAEFADALLAGWESTVDSPVAVTGTVETLTGHPARSFASWADDHRADFTN